MIFQQGGPEVFRLAHHHGVAMFQRLLGQHGNVHSAHDHLDAAPPEMIRNFVAALDGGGHRRDANEVGGLVQIQRLDFLIYDFHFPFRRRERGDAEQAEVGQAKHHPARHEAVFDGGRDEQKFFHFAAGCQSRCTVER